MAVCRSRHIGIGVERPFAEVCAFLDDPANYPTWAEGLGSGLVHQSERSYRIDTPAGRAVVQFARSNTLGIADHTVFLESGETILNPMRVVPNDTGSEVIFSLFQRPGMSNEMFERDAAAVAKDLRVLKALLEKARPRLEAPRPSSVRCDRRP